MSELQNKNYHHGNLRNELLDTAEAQLGAGVEELSLRALARAVGVSQTAPYRHFSDKNALLAALATRGYNKLLQALHAAASQADGDPLRELYNFAHAYVNYAVDNADLFKLMFGPTLQPIADFPELRTASRATYNLVRDIMRKGITQGLFADHDVEYLANAGWAGIHGLATLKIDTPQLFEKHIELHRQIDLGVRLFVEGLRRRDS
jgi:AcrR family transcriptional regulator